MHPGEGAVQRKSFHGLLLGLNLLAQSTADDDMRAAGLCNYYKSKIFLILLAYCPLMAIKVLDYEVLFVKPTCTVCSQCSALFCFFN